MGDDNIFNDPFFSDLNDEKFITKDDADLFEILSKDTKEKAIGVLAKVAGGFIEKYHNAKTKVESVEALQSVWMVANTLGKTIEESGITSVPKKTKDKLSEFTNKIIDRIEANPDYPTKGTEEKRERVGKVVGRVIGQTASLCAGAGLGVVESMFISSAIMASAAILFGPTIAVVAGLTLGSYASYKATEKTIKALDNRISPATAQLGDEIDQRARRGVNKIKETGSHVKKIVAKKFTDVKQNRERGI